MKQQLLILGLLLAIVPCFSQTIQTQGSPKRATQYLGGLQADSTLVVPVRNRDSIYPNLPYKGRVQINSETNILEYHNGEEWVIMGSGVSGEANKIEDEIDGYTAHVGFPETATADSYWIFPQAYSSEQHPVYVPLEINGAVASSGGSVSVGLQGVLNASASDNKITGYDRLNFYIPDSSMDIYPTILTYNSTPDEVNFTTVGGVRNDGRTFGPDAIAENDYITKSQLDDSLASATSPIVSIDEGNGSGIILAERNEENYGNVGLGAVDLSTSPDGSVERGATGDYSFATGQYTLAQGDYSFAAGIMNKATAPGAVAFGEACNVESSNSFAAGSQITIEDGGYNSAAFGSNTKVTSPNAFATGYYSEANGPGSVAMGNFTNAAGGISTALGSNTITNAYASTVIGYNNLPISEAVENSPVEGSPLFIIGNGADNSTGRSNAYVLFNDGNSVQNGIAAYGEDYSESYTDRSLVDKEYVDEVTFEGNSLQLKKIIDEHSGIIRLPENFQGNFVWEFPQSDGFEESPTYVIRSVSGQQANSNGELQLDLQSTINYSYSDENQPIASNERLHFYVTPSETTSNFITWYNYNPIDFTFIPVSGIKHDGRAYGPIALQSEDYTPLSQVENLISDATGDLDAEGILTNGSVASVQSTIDLRSGAGLILTHSTTGNKLELNSDGLEYNGDPLVDKSTLIGYIASATNTSFTAHKTASDLNAAYPGVYEGFLVKCPNAGVIYIKTSLPGQWQLIGATTLNP